MADNDKQLPEGTDHIVAGATGTGADGNTVATDTTLVTEREIVAPKPNPDNGFVGSGSPGGESSANSGSKTGAGASGSSGGAGRGGALFGEPGQPMAQRLRDGGEKLSSQATQKARGLVSQGLDRSSEALANVSRLIGETAPGLDDRLGEDFGDYARRAAGAIEQAANGLAGKDPDELIDDTRNFIRKSPGVALAGAAIVGFALARLVKMGIMPADRSDDEGSRDR